MVDYALIKLSVYEGNAEETKRLARAAQAEGRSLMEVLQEGLIAGVRVAEEERKRSAIGDSQLVAASRAMVAGMSVLKGWKDANEMVEAIDDYTREMG